MLLILCVCVYVCVCVYIYIHKSNVSGLKENQHLDPLIKFYFGGKLVFVLGLNCLICDNNICTIFSAYLDGLNFKGSIKTN